jgi:hypothetical protein
MSLASWQEHVFRQEIWTMQHKLFIKPFEQHKLFKDFPNQDNQEIDENEALRILP